MFFCSLNMISDEIESLLNCSREFSSVVIPIFRLTIATIKTAIETTLSKWWIIYIQIALSCLKAQQNIEITVFLKVSPVLVCGGSVYQIYNYSNEVGPFYWMQPEVRFIEKETINQNPLKFQYHRKFKLCQIPL